MIKKIIPISTRYYLTVNAYLLEFEAGFILIDTGFAKRRDDLVSALEEAGCNRDNLKLVILTHGDPDHVGNASFLRSEYGVGLAMHRADTGMVERCDMTWNRGMYFGQELILKAITPFIKCETFKPDLYLKAGERLDEYGLAAEVIHIPGHSKGSIGIVTDSGALFCGDLFNNIRKPTWHIIVDKIAASNSLVRIRDKSHITTVYPGHGDPFAFEDLRV